LQDAEAAVNAVNQHPGYPGSYVVKAFVPRETAEDVRRYEELALQQASIRSLIYDVLTDLLRHDNIGAVAALQNRYAQHGEYFLKAVRSILKTTDVSLELRHCLHCGAARSLHINAKCLFQPTNYAECPIALPGDALVNAQQGRSLAAANCYHDTMGVDRRTAEEVINAEIRKHDW
jgi:hypothetical protein